MDIDKQKAEDKKEELELSVEEQQLIAEQRESQVKLDKANKAVVDTLKKHNATLQINPHSPIGSPRVMVVLNK